MRRWVSSSAYRRAIQQLVAARGRAELTQREVASRLGKPASFVAKVELGERRLDFIEFIAWARAVGESPGALLAAIEAELGGQIDI